MKPAEAQNAALIARMVDGAKVALGLFNKDLNGRTFLLEERIDRMKPLSP